MIIEALFNSVTLLLTLIFDLLPDLPNLPESATTAINSVLDVIFENSSMLGFFVHIDTIKILVPLLIIVINFDKIYALLMWTLRKLPFLGMK